MGLYNFGVTAVSVSLCFKIQGYFVKALSVSLFSLPNPQHSFFFFLLINLFFGCVGSSLLHAGFLSSCSERGLLFIVVCGYLIAVASLVAEHRL